MEDLTEEEESTIVKSKGSELAIAKMEGLVEELLTVAVIQKETREDTEKMVARERNERIERAQGEEE